MKGSYINKAGLAPASTSGIGKVSRQTFAEIMNILIKILTRFGLLRKDLDYHLVRASMVIIYFFFGYQKWFPYEAHTLIPFISNGPLISWMYPVFGLQGASWFLGICAVPHCAYHPGLSTTEGERVLPGRSLG
jgi:hypothetical protein